MSDEPMEQILAALTRIEANITRIEAKQDKERAEIMLRIARLQTRFDDFDDRQTLILGSFARIERRNPATSEDTRILGQQTLILTQMIHRLSGRIDGIEQPKP